ncbi:replication initiator protein A [Rhodopseudomonas palustris]|uniref:Replication initiator protein A n=4 Tax=Rhodopseudomonas palustris TaxID=1076 RepID=A0ACD5B3U5_RHOPA|nr:replication initiator protein A [Rhodopseudomonas palustris]OPF89576.1 replication protein [Rhodopseudomonas palustris]WAB80248.1 replication initiator protein A [Rhodopseudomonas palustris]WND54141.1 replication initiator protein A [Rhodopseudomonas palustris]
MANPSNLNFMPREQFAALSLHEKNDYLQGLAERFAASTGREHEPLDKDALSRLRRYYSRRKFADLELEGKPDTGLNASLRRLSNAIRNADLNQDIEAVLMQEMPQRVLREPPTDDAQLMFFVPTIYDAPIKDDVNLMDVAPFTLGKNVRQGVITYEMKDCLITIEGGAEVGLATVFDYDIFLNMVSYLAEEVRRYRIDDAKGLRPSLPPKMYRPTAAHLLKFSRRASGGRQYQEIEAALRRLSKTSITITNLAGGKRRQVDTRPLIGEHTIISSTNTGKVDQIEIRIPDWVYSSVVRSDKALPLLTLHPDYFLITSGLGRFIYRLARKAAGKDEARYSVAELHKRSGSSREPRKFLFDLKEFVTRTQTFPMPDFDLALEQGKGGPILLMKRRPAMPTTPEVIQLAAN